MAALYLRNVLLNLLVLVPLLAALLAIPRLVLLLVCASLWRPGLTTVVVVLVLTGWMGVARMVRAELLGVKTRPFVDAATGLGASSARVLWRHALPNSLGPAIVATTLGVGNAILLESGLSFLGLGVQPPRPSWGNMIAGGRDLIVVAPWVAIAPGLAPLRFSRTLIGDDLRDRLAETGPLARSFKSSPARSFGCGPCARRISAALVDLRNGTQFAENGFRGANKILWFSPRTAKSAKLFFSSRTGQTRRPDRPLAHEDRDDGPSLSRERDVLTFTRRRRTDSLVQP
jgi:hypothetical protein